ENEQQFGEIIYDNLFFLKADINVVNTEKYKVEPIGFLGTRISVTQNETPIASLSLSWNGKIIITFQDGQEFSLKLDDIFSNKYILENKNNEKLLQIESKFDWKEFHYINDISYSLEYIINPRNILLLLLSIYSTNFFIATMSGANASRPGFA